LVKDAIWKLREKKRNEIPDHVWPELKTIDKYRHYYATGKYGWYILKWNEPAPSFGNVMKTYILHPDSFNGQSTRVISVREALLVMGFDNSFRFPQDLGLGARYQMIVDAVSPVFSYAAARVSKDLLG
jgi:DNA (cytosine-5)-methyltransferase 1